MYFECMEEFDVTVTQTFSAIKSIQATSVNLVSFELWENGASVTLLQLKSNSIIYQSLAAIEIKVYVAASVGIVDNMCLLCSSWVT